MNVEGTDVVVLKRDELMAELAELNHGQMDPILLAQWIEHHDMANTYRGQGAIAAVIDNLPVRPSLMANGTITEADIHRAADRGW